MADGNKKIKRFYPEPAPISEQDSAMLRSIMQSDNPSAALEALYHNGQLASLFPELTALAGVETKSGRGHKDNFAHTMQVLSSVAAQSSNEWLRWAALLHDIGKPATKRWDENVGWTFHNHNFIGEKMVPRIFKRLRLPREHVTYVKKLVGLHMRPIAIVGEVTDSAVRRLTTDAGNDLDDLMILCNADITSKNQEKVARFRKNFEIVKQKIEDLKVADKWDNYQPPINGDDIMLTFGLNPGEVIKQIKEPVRIAMRADNFSQCFARAYQLMLKQARSLGFKPVMEGKLCYNTIDSPVGVLTIAASVDGVALLAINDTGELLNKHALKMHLKPVSTPNLPLLNHATAQLNAYFAGELREFDLPLHLVGTPFQQAAWRAMLTIPYGETISYKEQALRAGNPQAFRAVAQANRVNPIPIIIPCHRVINSNHHLGGYSYGIHIKQHLLSLEQNNCS